jgi:putative endonuclease
LAGSSSLSTRASKVYYIYILKSESTGKLYTGQTNNLERRIKEHNTRIKRYTSNKGPWKLIYSEKFESRELAMKREKILKTGKGREFIKLKISESGE